MGQPTRHGEPARMDALYPPIEPYDHGWLAVGDGHEVYY